MIAQLGERQTEDLVQSRVTALFSCFSSFDKHGLVCTPLCLQEAVIAQLGECQTEDLKVPGSIPGHGTFFLFFKF